MLVTCAFCDWPGTFVYNYWGKDGKHKTLKVTAPLKRITKNRGARAIYVHVSCLKQGGLG